MEDDKGDLIYETYQKQQFQRFEDVCRRCGECCGSEDGDPCVNLAKDKATEKYYCKIYENRLGPQRTASGKIFNCVLINAFIKWNDLRPNCAYNKNENPCAVER